MIDHIGFPVSDYERARAFYTKALAPLAQLRCQTDPAVVASNRAPDQRTCHAAGVCIAGRKTGGDEPR